MNRSLLAFALSLGLAAGASAQNSATTSQTGTGNDVTVDQIYTSGDVSTVNQVAIDQSGASHTAIARQRGAGNDIDIDQSGANHVVNAEELLGYSNSMVIEQVGGDAATATGGRNRVSAAVRGDLNDVDILQSGSGNEALINLKAGQNDENVFNLSQTGADNEIEVRGSGNGYIDRNTLMVEQVGDRNTLGVRGGPADGVIFASNTDDNAMDVYQFGNDNAATIEFAAQSSFNTVDLDQLSNGNTATITFDGTNNTSTITQQ